MIKLSADALEEVEGRFMARFGRIPTAEETMTLYAIETHTCPLCGAKLRDGEATIHMANRHFEMDVRAV